ncbi:MAG: formylglycine-generating enzyme family protein [bacterium]|nr:formylglycine-generating enzyme family protein [bacterium]
MILLRFALVFMLVVPVIPRESTACVNGPGIEFIYVPPGNFAMGERDTTGDDDELPRHNVTLSEGFYLGKFEVTQEQWKKVMGSNPSTFRGDRLPVENVSWLEVRAFIKKLNDAPGTETYSLPTEAEWEYACKAGSTERYFFGRNRHKLHAYGWFEENSKKQTHAVGLKKPNQWGFHDMYGNVWEWCTDWYNAQYYRKSPTENPRSLEPVVYTKELGPHRVLRGGCRLSCGTNCRSANRFHDAPDFRSSYIGFRLKMKR